MAYMPFVILSLLASCNYLLGKPCQMGSAANHENLQLGIQNSTYGIIRIGNEYFDVLDPGLPAALNRMYLTAMNLVNNCVSPPLQPSTRSAITSRIQNFVGYKILPMYNFHKQCRTNPKKCEQIPLNIQDFPMPQENVDIFIPPNFNFAPQLVPTPAALDSPTKHEIESVEINVNSDEESNTTKHYDLLCPCPACHTCGDCHDLCDTGAMDDHKQQLNKTFNILMSLIVIAFILGVIVGYVMHKCAKKKRSCYPKFEEISKERILKLSPKSDKKPGEKEESLSRLLEDGVENMERRSTGAGHKCPAHYSQVKMKSMMESRQNMYTQTSNKSTYK